MSDNMQAPKKVFLPQTPTTAEVGSPEASKASTVQQFPAWDLLPPAKILNRRRISR